MPVTSQRSTRTVSIGLAAALSVSGLAVIAAPPVAAVPGSVTGTVFQDYNSNGLYDTGNLPESGVPNDRPLPNVTVTAYDASNDVLAQTSSLDDGTYELAGLGADGTPVRVEFTDLPAGWYGTFHGSGPGIANGTSVQFAAVGDENVDFGANVPEDHNQGDPFMAVALQTQGDPLTSTGVAGRPSLALFPSSKPLDGDTTDDVVFVATQGQTGAVWGTAFDRVHRTLFASAVYKRQSGLGPLGLGGIYRLPGIVDELGQYTSPAVVEEWLDVQGMPVQGGGTIDLGTVPSNADRGLAGPTVPSHDPDAYVQAGKVGILGIAVSPDGGTLYFINGNDKQIYALDISDPAVTPTEAVRIDLDLGTGQRPWAIESRFGQLYVGYVDSGEDLPPGSTAEGLEFTVVSTPEEAPGAWTEVLVGPLDYARVPGEWFDVAPQASRWNAWVDEWSWDELNGVSSVVAVRPGDPPYRMQVFPQAILSDITFDRDGYLVVSLMDRVMMQGGLRNYPSDSLDEEFTYIARAVGDVLVAAPGGDAWVLESDGSVGDRVSAQGVGTNAGPGGGEFIFDSAPAAVNIEKEMAFGAGAVPPGMEQIAIVGADPTRLNSNGVQWFDLGNGNKTDNSRFLTDTFSKAPGIGAIDDLALAAPVQIGNRVWFDADQNGRQDADEPPVEGVTVELLDASDTVLATTVTDAAGEYYFSTNDPQIDGFVPGGDYSVRFVRPDSGNLFDGDPRFGTVPWDAVGFTEQFAADATPTTDSDPDPATGLTPVFTLGGPGENDHAFDAGLVADAVLELAKAIDEEGVPASPGQSFGIIVTATDFRGDPYEAGSGEFDVLAGGSTIASMPVGTWVTITEAPDGSVVSYTVSPPGPVLVSGTDADPTIVTVINLLREMTDVEVSKIVGGDGQGEVNADFEFTIDYEWTLGDANGTGSVTLVRDTSALIEEVPVGAELTLSEAATTPPPGVAWGTPRWSGDGVTDNGDGTATVAVESDTEIQVDLENEAILLPDGSFTILKALDGPGGLVDPSTEFTIAYTLNGVPQPDLIVTPAAGVIVEGLELGDDVMLGEAQLPDLPGVDWGEPTWTVGGDPAEGNEIAFEITQETPTFALVVTNHFEGVYGSFSITKALSGIQAGQLPVDAEFSGTYDYPGRPGGPGTFAIAAGQTWTLPADELILDGTEVTITELSPTVTLPAGYVWRTPVFSGTGVTDHGDGVASITVGDGATVEVTLTNVVTEDLPVTGAALAPWIAIAALLLLGAGGLLLVLRRARNRGATT